MQLDVRAPSDPVVDQVAQLSLFYLTGLDGEVERAAINIERVRDRLDTALHRCEVDLLLPGGARICVGEVQGDLVLAITRSLDRAVRTLYRRRGLAGLRRSA